MAEVAPTRVTPSGDPPPRPIASPYQDPGSMLRYRAALLERMMQGQGGRRPARWDRPRFRREVELIRAHLRPIHTPEMLAASYGRESFHRRELPGPADAGREALSRSPAEVADALRWLELTGLQPEGSPRLGPCSWSPSGWS